MQIWLFRVTKVEVCEFNGTGNVYKLTMRTIPTIGSLDSRYLSLKTKTPQNNLGRRQNLLEQGMAVTTKNKGFLAEKKRWGKGFFAEKKLMGLRLF